MSYKSIAHFCFMYHYDIAYRGPDTRSANIASKCNFTVYPALIFFRICNHHKNFMHYCSDMNPLYEHTEHDFNLSALTRCPKKTCNFLKMLMLL